MPTVLVIDDDADFRAFLRRVLEGEGFEVEEAGDGRRGVSSYRRSPVDLVLCDLYMDELDGLGVIRELRRDYPGVRIIAMSAGSPRTGRDFLHEAKLLGATATLAKPCGREAVIKAVNDARS